MFHLKNAAPTFNQAMNEPLLKHCLRVPRRYRGVQPKIYCVQHLHAVFTALQRVNLGAKLEKCQVARGSIHYLRHVVASRNHTLNSNKFSAVGGSQVPKPKKEPRSVLRLCRNYQGYMPNYTEVAASVTEPTGEKIPNKISPPTKAKQAL